MATVCHLRFVKFNILTISADKKPILRQHTIALFVIFKMAAAAIIGFLKIRNFNSRSAVGRGAHVGHRVKFHQNQSKGCRDMAIKRFLKWWPSAIFDF